MKNLKANCFLLLQKEIKKYTHLDIFEPYGANF